MTTRIIIGAKLILVANRVSSRTAIGCTGLIHRGVRRVNCASPAGGKFSTSDYTIVMALSRRSHSVTRKISRTRRAHSTSDSRAFSTVNTNSRKVVFNFTYGRAPRLVPLPNDLTRHVTQRLTSTHGAKLLPCLQPSNGARMAITCRSNGPINVSAVLISARRATTVNSVASRTTIRRGVGASL